MVAASFAESNCVLARPDELTAEQCEPLSVFMGTCGDLPLVISCWKLTGDELDEIVRTGRIWLLVVGGTMPPVSLQGFKPAMQPNKEV